MDLTGLLTSCHYSVQKHKQLCSLASKLPAVLVLCLCSCMFWQFSTCLVKYFASPTGASVAFSQDLSQSPIAITICIKGEKLENFLLELRSVDIRKWVGSEWHTIWPAAGPHLNVSVTAETFFAVTSQKRLRLCKTFHVHESMLSELRLQQYSNASKNNKLEVHLHNQGLFLSPAHHILILKTIFTDEKNFILELTLETRISLPSAEFNCGQEDEAAQTLDSCLLAQAVRVANQSAGCLSKSLR